MERDYTKDKIFIEFQNKKLKAVRDGKFNEASEFRDQEIEYVLENYNIDITT